MQNAPSQWFVRVLNVQGISIFHCFWIDQSSEYASGSEYIRALEYARFTQGSEYVWICLNSPWICLIMPQYVWIYQGSEYALICVNRLKSVYQGNSIKFRVHVNIDWFRLLKLKVQVIRLQKNLLSLNCSWSVAGTDQVNFSKKVILSETLS